MTKPTSISKWQNLDQVAIMSAGFMLLFTAFNTCQNFAAKVLKDDGFDDLGSITLAALYFTFGVSSFFSSAIVKAVGNVKLTMGFGAFCYSFWIVCFMLPAFYA